MLRRKHVDGRRQETERPERKEIRRVDGDHVKQRRPDDGARGNLGTDWIDRAAGRGRRGRGGRRPAAPGQSETAEDDRERRREPDHHSTYRVPAAITSWPAPIID